MRSHLAAHGLTDYEFHDAIGPDDREVQQAYNDDKVTGFPPCFRCGKTACGRDDCNNVLIAPQVAVFLSYLSLWRKILQRQECALVCEDDVVLHPWWKDVMSMLCRKQESHEIEWRAGHPSLIRLGWAESEEHNAAQPFRISREIRMANPMHLITPAYAQLLIDEFERINHTADVFLHRTSKAAQEFAWTAHPPAATELSWSRGEVDSLIHPKRIRSEYLRSMGDDHAALVNDQRISAHVGHMFHRHFLIVGHPRCGTGFTAKFLQQMGFDIGHEKDGLDGLASWMFAVDGPVPCALSQIAERRETLSWNKLVMPVRDIRTAIPLIMHENIFSPPSYDFRRKHILAWSGYDLNELADNFHRAVVSFLSWCRMVEELKPALVFRIEHDAFRLYDFASKEAGANPPSFDRLDLFPVNFDKLYRGQKRGKADISAEHWGSLPPDLWSEVEEYCKRFDYPVPERKTTMARPSSQPSVDLSGLEKQFCKPAGWSRSLAESRPVRADGRALPWFTFGAIEFLEQVVRRSDQVFEYGAGYSTLWWQQKVKEIVSVENDAEWVARLQPQLKENAHLNQIERYAAFSEDYVSMIEAYRMRMRRTNWPAYEPERIIRRGLMDEGFEAYAASIMNYPGFFDIIVIDGMARRLCTVFAVEKIAPTGMIVFDNSNRRDYDAAYDILEEANFKQIPFWGLVPGANFMTCTSVFTRGLERLPGAAHCPNSHHLPEY